MDSLGLIASNEGEGSVLSDDGKQGERDQDGRPASKQHRIDMADKSDLGGLQQPGW